MSAFEPLQKPDATHSVANKMSAELADTFRMVGSAAAVAVDPWWIIGSAAVVLHGGEVPHVKDVDLLMSARDADAFLRRIAGERRKATASRRFRSVVFGTWSKPPISVEVFGGFSVALNGRWREVTLLTREAVTIDDVHIFVPSAEELVRLLHSFGRAKDIRRARLLRP